MVIIIPYFQGYSDRMISLEIKVMSIVRNDINK